MARHIHFVVAYDTATKDFVVDDETLIARFPDGAIYDDVTGYWVDDVDETVFDVQDRLVAALERDNYIERKYNYGTLRVL